MKSVLAVLLCGMMASGVVNASVGSKPDMVKIKKMFKQVEGMKYSNRSPVSEPSAYRVLFPEMVKVYQKTVKKPQLVKTGLKPKAEKKPKPAPVKAAPKVSKADNKGKPEKVKPLSKPNKKAQKEKKAKKR